MTKLKIDEHVYDIDVAVFDKDGTLVDFDHMWGNMARKWLDGLVAAWPLDTVPADLNDRLAATLGYELDTGRVVPDSPFAVTTLAKLSVVAMTALYQSGLSWDQAEVAVESMLAGIDDTITADLVLPIGDVKGSLLKLKQAGIKIVIATNDDRPPTTQTLPLLGIDGIVDLVLCGDDDRANKPSPEGIRFIEEQLGVPAERMIMVGDTNSDMVFGQRGGTAASVGISGGGGNVDKLTGIADVIVPSIDYFEVL